MSNTLKLSIAVLLVTVSLAKAHHQMCADDMDEEACKMHMMMQMDKEVMETHTMMMKIIIERQMEMMNDAMKDLEADDPRVLKMKARMDIMKIDMDMMDKMKDMDDNAEMQEMVEKLHSDMKFDCDEDDGVCKLMREKYDKKMIEVKVMETMMEFENIWTHMYGDLREKDMVKYPMYKELNDMMDEMKAENDLSEKGKKMMMMLRKMMKFQQTPYMKAMLGAMCANCDE